MENTENKELASDGSKIQLWETPDLCLNLCFLKTAHRDGHTRIGTGQEMTSSVERRDDPNTYHTNTRDSFLRRSEFIALRLRNVF